MSVAKVPQPGQSRWVRFRRALIRDRWLYLIMILPCLYYLLFHYYPMYGVTLAFKQYKPKLGIIGSPWASQHGMKYILQVVNDPYFWTVFKNTIVLNVVNLAITFSDPALPPLTTDHPEAVNALHPRFSGRVRYEAEVTLAENQAALLLPDMTGTAEVWLDETPLGYRAAPPYRFDLPEGCHGPHTLRLETVVPLVQSHRDALSFFNYIKPAGLTGPVQWLHREVHHG